MTTETLTPTENMDNTTSPKRKKKTLPKVLMILAIIFVTLFFLVRIVLWFGIKKHIPDVGTGAEYFTAYDVTNESYELYETDEFSIMIPPTMELSETELEDAFIFRGTEDTDGSILIRRHFGEEPISLFERSMYEGMSDKGFELLKTFITPVFSSLGYGVPDSTYNTFKIVHLLDESDRSFWSLKKQLAFAVMGYLKHEIVVSGQTWVYETDQLCGFVQIGERKGLTTGMIELYPIDQPNDSYFILMKAKTPEEIYATINSFTFKET